MTPPRASLSSQPLIFTLSGVAVAYAIYRLSQQVSTSRSTTTLHRSNAIRRRALRAGGREAQAPRTLDEEEARDLIARLRHRDTARADYGGGFFRLEESQLEGNADNGGFRYRYLPSQLPSADTFVQSGFPAAAAQQLVVLAQLNFLDHFLQAELPPGDHGEIGAYIVPSAGRYLVNELLSMGILSETAHTAIQWISNCDLAQTGLREYYGLTLQQRERLGDPEPPIRAADEVTEVQSDHMGQVGTEMQDTSTNGQEMVALLYRIAEDNAQKSYYIHRGVQCNACSLMPIRGVRYHCANCSDYDLCESCESKDEHNRTHVFYKIRIPIPWNNGPKQAQPVWYPGKPTQLHRILPAQITERLAQQHNFESSHIHAMWDQFRVIAATEWDQDPSGIGLAIDRSTFNKAFLPSTGSRPPPPNLIFDRIFHFYDVNDDGLIGFAEFVGVQACLDSKTRNAKLRRIFTGYDLDGDGYVDRKDFLRMFRAWYILKRDFMRDLIINMEDGSNLVDAREIVLGSQPISAAFYGAIHPGHDSRTGEGKAIQDGDLTVVDNSSPLREDALDTLDRNAMISEVEQKRYERQSRLRHGVTVQDTIVAAFRRKASDELQTLIQELRWPPPDTIVAEVDIRAGLGASVPIEEIVDSDDQLKVLWATASRLDEEEAEKTRQAGTQAVHDRWLKRKFYTDIEEGGIKPPGYTESDTSDDDDDDGDDSDGLGAEGASFSGSRPISPRSRSSSKVRFEDSITDTDYETRSNTSSRSIPIGERWGGFEISEMERDVGSEILYQAVYEGFNELLDGLFKQREEDSIRAQMTRKLRELYNDELEEFIAAKEGRSPSKTAGVQTGGDPELKKLLDDSGYMIDSSLSGPTHPYHTTHESRISAPVRAGSPERTLADPNERSEDIPDPTLPQNRPNSPSTAVFLTTQSDGNPGTESHPTPFNPQGVRKRNKPNASMLRGWMEDRRTEAITKERGGPARINFAEFEKFITPDSTINDGIGEGGINKLGFVGSWIDMVGFY